MCAMFVRRGGCHTETNSQWCPMGSPLYQASKQEHVRIVKLLLDHGMFETNMPTSLINDCSARIRAMLAQRAPPHSLLSRCPEPISSVSDLIYEVHVTQPYLQRQIALDIVYHEAIARTRQSVESAPAVVFEIVAAFSTGRTLEFYARCRGAPIADNRKQALEKGLAISQSMQTSRTGYAFRRPWWMWNTILQTLYAVPAEWTSATFWQNPARPCVSSVVIPPV